MPGFPGVSGGTRTALFTGMGFITMWKHGARRCVFIVGGEHLLLRLVDGTSILREQVVIGADAAATVAERWNIEDHPAPQPEPHGLAFA
jgi:hypothetical protein